MERSWLCWGQDCRVSVILFVPVNGTLLTMLCPAPQLGVKALTYSDLIQAQKEISAHNQQLREQSEQLQKDNSELRSQSLRLVCAGRGGHCWVHTLGWRIAHSLARRCALGHTWIHSSMLLLDSVGPSQDSFPLVGVLYCHTGLYYIACLWVDYRCYALPREPGPHSLWLLRLPVCVLPAQGPVRGAET